MTAEQYEKGAQVFHNIKQLKRVIDEVTSNDLAVRISIQGLEYWLDTETTKDYENYILINQSAIRAEVLDVLKDHLKRLEDELNTI